MKRWPDSKKEMYTSCLFDGKHLGLNTSLTCTLFIHYSSTGFEYVLDLYIVHTLQQYGFWSAGFEYVLDLYIVHTLQQYGFWIRPWPVHCSYTTAVRVLNTSLTCTLFIHYTCTLFIHYGIRPSHVHCSYTTAVRVFNTSWTCTLFIHYSSSGFFWYVLDLTCTLFIHYSSTGFEYVLDLYIVHTLQQYGFWIRPWPVHCSYTTAVRVLNMSLTCTLFIHYSSAGFEYVLDLYIIHTLQ